MRPANMEIFRDILQNNGMIHLADSFLLASGKLQALCYKADVEAALRTRNFGGFQLLGLNDFRDKVQHWSVCWMLSGKKKVIFLPKSTAVSVLQPSLWHVCLNLFIKMTNC